MSILAEYRADYNFVYIYPVCAWDLVVKDLIARPPGHHAGPRGAVPCDNHFHWRPDMCSSGFCLVNNVAIGAAHALRTYGRREGRDESRGGSNDAVRVEKVAIVDFDIHEYVS